MEDLFPGIRLSGLAAPGGPIQSPRYRQWNVRPKKEVTYRRRSWEWVPGPDPRSGRSTLVFLPGNGLPTTLPPAPAHLHAWEKPSVLGPEGSTPPGE